MIMALFTRHILSTISRQFALIASSLALAGCASYTVNPPTETIDIPDRVDIKNIRNKEQLIDETLFVLTFSGGGTRAAAFSYGVLEALANTTFEAGGNRIRMLDEVDVISSVSGGSFTAAYYGLFGERIFEDFETRFLKENIQGSLVGQVFRPVNWFRLPSRKFNRSDLAAELYDRKLFENLTFGDLLGKGGPAVVINATDATYGSSFRFVQHQFDWICSDLSNYPISRAVAASSAVPGVLGSITLNNYAGDCDFTLPEWVQETLGEGPSFTLKYQQATRVQSYLDAEKRPFIHLLDGGLSDNLGVRALIEELTQTGGLVSALDRIGADRTNKIVVLIVNAATASSKELNYLEKLPLFSQLSVASGVPIYRYNYETINLLLRTMDDWKELLLGSRCPAGNASNDGISKECEPIESYIINVSFDALSDETERDYFKALPTSFRLKDEEVDNLRDAAVRILENSAEYQRLLLDLQQTE